MSESERGRASALAGLWLPSLLAACRPGPAPDGPPPALAPSCGPAGERFADVSFLPRETRLVAWIALHDPALEGAGARLRELGAESGLPIRALSQLRQLGFEVGLLRVTLARAGFAPAELLRVEADGGDAVFVWPTSCDVDRAQRRISEAWGLSPRRVVDGVIGTPRDGTFAFDALLLRGDRAALVPAGRGAAVLDWLGRPSPQLGPGAPTPGDRLSQLAPAPIRAVVQGHGLIVGQGDAPPDARTLRATAAAVEIDGQPAEPTP